jgi:hypothetical protein
MFYSNTLSFIGIPATLLLLAGLILAIYALIKGKDALFTYSALSVVIGFFTVLVIIILPSYNDDDVSNGLSWSKCKLIEENAFNGSFSENVNKLDCDGRIINIPISVYRQSIMAFEIQKENKLRK